MSINLLVPQLFYDLIGRVVPGGALFAVTLLLALGMDPTVELVDEWATVSPTGLVLAAVLFSYVVGALLGGVWFLVLRCAGSRVARRQEAEVAKDYEGCQAREPDLKAMRPSTRLAVLYDFAQSHCPRTGARIVKLRAEQHMSGVFLVGSLLLLPAVEAIRFVSPATAPPAPPLAIAAAIATAGLSSALGLLVHLEDRSLRAMYNCWHYRETLKPSCAIAEATGDGGCRQERDNDWPACQTRLSTCCPGGRSWHEDRFR